MLIVRTSAILVLGATVAVAGDTQAIVGNRFTYVASKADTLAGVSARFGVSKAVLATENNFPTTHRLRVGESLLIDNRHVVPVWFDRGIVINVPQRMLFWFDGRSVVAYPTAVGRRTWQTPTGDFTVIRKREDPTWIVPDSIQDEMEAEGKDVLDVVPPGPDNPLGSYALDLSIPGYRIHGTNEPISIYSFRTHGCIRLHPKDIEALFDAVNVGDRGRIVYQPVMLAVGDDGAIYLEVDRDIYRQAPDPFAAAHESAELQNLGDRIDWDLAAVVIQKAEGIARRVSR
jgi:L,D-transpeptidase ErfK/SrfK